MDSNNTSTQNEPETNQLPKTQGKQNTTEAQTQAQMAGTISY